MDKPREKWIDCAKGIAILLVVLGHVKGSIRGLDWVFGVHLVVFFLISGYTFTIKPVTRVFLNQKFSRLMVPYFATCTAILVTDVVTLRSITIKDATFVIGRDLLRSFFASGSITNFGEIEFGTRIGAVWFLPALFFAILFLQIILNCFRDNSTFAGVVAVLIAVLGSISARFIWLPFSVQSGMTGTLFLWFGYEIRENDVLEKLKREHYIIALVILLFGIRWHYCGISFATAFAKYTKDIFISTVVGLSGCILIYWLSVKIPGHIFAYLGQISLTILCTHLYALETMTDLFYSLVDLTNQSGLVRDLLFLFIEVLFAVLTAAFIDRIKPYLRAINSRLFSIIYQKEDSLRDVSIDTAKGILIISMIIAHFPIDGRLRTIIFSCHMVAFVFLSGYFYNSNRSFYAAIRHMIKTLLLPYCVFVAGVLLLNINQWSLGFIRETLIQYAFGISYSNKVFTDIPSVGPVYFILLLFFVRVIYMLIDRFAKRTIDLWIIVLGVSLGGVYLGHYGFWLPWSIDVAFYCVAFYHLGYQFRQRGILDSLKKKSIVYFLLSPIWVFSIYSGGMEIAIRKYGEYGIIIIGAVSGIVLIVMLAGFIDNHLPICRELFRFSGEASIIILIIHTLLGRQINSFISRWFHPDYLPYLIVSLVIQVCLGLLIKLLIKSIRTKAILYNTAL